MSAILGQEMAVPTLWAPGIFGSFCWKTPHAHNIPRFRGGLFFFGGGKCQFYFLGVGIFLNLVPKLCDAISNCKGNLEFPGKAKISKNLRKSAKISEFRAFVPFSLSLLVPLKRVLRCVLSFLGNLLAQNGHLQCYRLRCFSFAQWPC